MKSIRILLFIATILLLTASILSSVLFNNNFLMRKWNIPAAPPGFSDSRKFTWAAESYAQGYDPLFENPMNRQKQPLNYPRIWHLLFALGINESHTNTMGSIIVILFFIGAGLFWFSGKFDNLTYIILSIVILSPTVMLGIERSNLELVLFFLFSLALTMINYSSIAAFFVFLFASILKLYPIFGFVYLLKEQEKRFWILFLSAIGIFVIYVLLSFNDIRQVLLTTPKLVGSSFGINVWWMGLRHSRFLDIPISESLMLILQVLSYLIALLILGVTMFYSMRRKDNRLLSEAKYIDSFRVGAIVYIGCFLLMNTHDYRMIFLIFTIPQIVVWLRDKERCILLIALVILTSMVLSLWSFFIMHFLGRKLTFIIEEFCNWVVLAGLLYLFFSSLPDWFRDYLRRLYSGTRRINKKIIMSND